MSKELQARIETAMAAVMLAQVVEATRSACPAHGNKRNG